MIKSIKFKVNNTGRVLRNIRLAAGISQTEVASQMQWSSSATVSHLEKGARGITLDKLDAVAGVLGFDVQIVLIKREEE